MIGPGDLVVCVDAGPIVCRVRHIVTTHGGSCSPALGTAHVVRGVRKAEQDNGAPTSCDCMTLLFDNGFRGVSRRFRKIEPDKHEADETCPALLKLSKQRSKEGANACGTALSSLRDEACCASSPFGFQSTFAGVGR